MSDREVAQVARQLSPKTTINNLFNKTDSIYSTVEVRESMLAQFYSEHQQEDVKFCLRLELSAGRPADRGCRAGSSKSH